MTVILNKLKLWYTAIMTTVILVSSIIIHWYCIYLSWVYKLKNDNRLNIFNRYFSITKHFRIVWAKYQTNLSIRVKWPKLYIGKKMYMHTRTYRKYKYSSLTHADTTIYHTCLNKYLSHKLYKYSSYMQIQVFITQEDTSIYHSCRYKFLLHECLSVITLTGISFHHTCKYKYL